MNTLHYNPEKRLPLLPRYFKWIGWGMIAAIIITALIATSEGGYHAESFAEMWHDQRFFVVLLILALLVITFSRGEIEDELTGLWRFCANWAAVVTSIIYYFATSSFKEYINLPQGIQSHLDVAFVYVATYHLAFFGQRWLTLNYPRKATPKLSKIALRIKAFQQKLYAQHPAGTRHPAGSASKKEVMTDFVKVIGALDSRKDFVNFIHLLLDDLRNNPAGWENDKLELYLEAMASWTEDMDGFYINNNLPAPENVDWRIFANIMMAATTYTRVETYNVPQRDLHNKSILMESYRFLPKPYAQNPTGSLFKKYVTPDFEKIIETVRSEEEFVDFVELLVEDLKNNPEGWGHNKLELYLKAMASWIEDMDGFYLHNDLPIPENVDWKVFANILMAATMYE